MQQGRATWRYYFITREESQVCVMGREVCAHVHEEHWEREGLTVVFFNAL